MTDVRSALPLKVPKLREDIDRNAADVFVSTALSTNLPPMGNETEI